MGRKYVPKIHATQSSLNLDEILPNYDILGTSPRTVEPYGSKNYLRIPDEVMNEKPRLISRRFYPYLYAYYYIHAQLYAAVKSFLRM